MYNGILYSLKKEGTSDTCYNINLENAVLSEISHTRTNTAQVHIKSPE